MKATLSLVFDAVLELPLADADILARYCGLHRTTIQRHLDRLVQLNYVQVIAPSLVGMTTSRLYLPTALGCADRFSTAVTPEDPDAWLRWSVAYGVDPVSMMKRLPRLPHLLSVYDVIAEFANQSRAYQATSFHRSKGTPLIAQAAPPEVSWLPNEAITSTDRWDHQHTEHLDASVLAVLTFTEPVNRHEVLAWQVDIRIDDELRSTNEIRNFLRTYASYQKTRFSYRDTHPLLVVVTSSLVRYWLWTMLAYQMEEYPDGIILLSHRQHGWPYVLGGTTNPPHWYERWRTLGRRGKTEYLTNEALPNLLCGSEGPQWLPLWPNGDEVTLRRLHQEWAMPEHHTWNIERWIDHLQQHAPVPQYARRAKLALHLSYRHHQLLTLVATAPLISLEDLALIMQLQPVSVLQLAQELRALDLVSQRMIRSTPALPAWDEEGFLWGWQDAVMTMQATTEGLSYLGGVYAKLEVLIHDHKRQTLHETGVVRFLVYLQRTLQASCPATTVRWQVGPACQMRYRTPQHISLWFRPDGIATVLQDTEHPNDRWMVQVAIELDMGHEHGAAIKEKIDRYRGWDEANRGRKETLMMGYAVKTIFHVLVITPTEEQRQRFVDEIQQEWFYCTTWYVTTMQHLIDYRLETLWTTIYAYNEGSATSFLRLTYFPQDDGETAET